MRELCVVPYGGLANRIRALNAAIEFARESNIPLKALWFKNFELNASFDDIFEMPEYEQLKIKEATLIDRFIYRSPRRHTLWIPRFIAPLLFDCRIYSADFVRLRNDGILEDTIKRGDNILIESCYEFGEYYPAISKNFIPKSDILTSINEFVSSNFSSKTIGVHIRRTDNAKSIEHSPLALFIEAMKREVEADSEVRFYVATDDKPTKDELKSIFGERILSIETDCNRNSVAGIKEAVFEMWLLSRTSKIYGSFYSSFSEIAAKIGDIPLEILSK